MGLGGQPVKRTQAVQTIYAPWLQDIELHLPASNHSNFVWKLCPNQKFLPSPGLVFFLKPVLVSAGKNPGAQRVAGRVGQAFVAARGWGAFHRQLKFTSTVTSKKNTQFIQQTRAYLNGFWLIFLMFIFWLEKPTQWAEKNMAFKIVRCFNAWHRSRLPRRSRLRLQVVDVVSLEMKPFRCFQVRHGLGPARRWNLEKWHHFRWFLSSKHTKEIVDWHLAQWHIKNGQICVPLAVVAWH